MSIWAIANQKGGVGKTTTVVTLAGLLAEKRQRVLLVDLDPHGSMTAYFGLDPDATPRGVFDLFQDEGASDNIRPLDLAVTTSVSGIDLLPASTALATLDRRLGQRGGMGLILRRAVTYLRASYAYILLDCPPTLGVLLVNALAACERLLIPVQTEFLALQGLRRMEHTLDMIEQSRGRRVQRLIVPTMYDRRTRASLSSLDALRESCAATLWSGVIPVDTRFRDASRRGLPLPQIDARARGTRAYAALLDELTGAPEAPEHAAGAL